MNILQLVSSGKGLWEFVLSPLLAALSFWLLWSWGSWSCILHISRTESPCLGIQFYSWAILMLPSLRSSGFEHVHPGHNVPAKVGHHSMGSLKHPGFIRQCCWSIFVRVLSWCWWYRVLLKIRSIVGSDRWTLSKKSCIKTKMILPDCLRLSHYITSFLPGWIYGEKVSPPFSTSFMT